jgi:hypothetical protein
MKDIVTGIIYTKNIQRAVIPSGPEGPLGDTLIISGLVYKRPDQASKPIGTFDVAAVTTSAVENTERRELSVELTFDKKFAKRSWIADLKGIFKNSKQRDGVNLSGVESFPLGGGLPDRPLVLGVSAGTGSFAGIDGTASITYDANSEFFTFRFDLA